MNIAILSDIHSNAPALKEVLNDISQFNIERIFILGDIFGYYPWADETYQLLKKIDKKLLCIKGNHDQIVLDSVSVNTNQSYSYAASYNQLLLQANEPAAIKWLQNLAFTRKDIICSVNFILCHGTPDDPINGRFYPDYEDPVWFPDNGDVYLLGHSHYPMLRKKRNGIIFNPGSVGQPRDGNPMPSWGLVETDTMEFTFHRSVYKNQDAIYELREMNWDKRAIAALDKKNPGELRY